MSRKNLQDLKNVLEVKKKKFSVEKATNRGKGNKSPKKSEKVNECNEKRKRKGNKVKIEKKGNKK